MVSDPSGTIVYTPARDLPGVEVLRADDCARRWRLFHETYTFCSVISAQAPAPWVYRRRQHALGRGMVSLMEPGEVHYNTAITPRGTFRVLFVQPSTVETAAAELGIASRHPHLRIAQLSDATLFQAANRLHTSQETEATPLERQSRFAVLLRGILHKCAEAPVPGEGTTPDRIAVRRAREFIHEHAADRITLDDLVAVSGGGSRFRLLRSFAAEVGLPPHAYQIRVRVTHARQLLAARRSPIEVATELGFADQSHFARHFRLICGVTPGEYRRSVAAIPGPQERSIRLNRRIDTIPTLS
jgi:AraC-like DNA-binding protein